MTQVHKCGICGKRGHNRKTCLKEYTKQDDVQTIRLKKINPNSYAITKRRSKRQTCYAKQANKNQEMEKTKQVEDTRPNKDKDAIPNKDAPLNEANVEPEKKVYTVADISKLCCNTKHTPFNIKQYRFLVQVLNDETFMASKPMKFIVGFLLNYHNPNFTKEKFRESYYNFYVNHFDIIALKDPFKIVKKKDEIIVNHMFYKLYSAYNQNV